MTSKLRIAVVGGGPAGLLFATLAKQRSREREIVLFEQNAHQVTFGFGVVFSQDALAFLERDAPDIHSLLAAELQSWLVQKIVHRDRPIVIDGNGFSAIARLALLEL